MKRCRTSKRTVAAAGVMAIASVVAAALAGGGASASPPPFVVSGTQIANVEFSFAMLQATKVQRAIETKRAQLSDACMAGKGFVTPPVDDPVTKADKKYAAAYADAIIGDDIASSEPLEPTSVKLPDGSSFEVLASWRPGTCAYQSYEALGGDPFLREALRQQIMIYQAQAGAVVESKLKDQVADWANCVGNDQLIAADLLRAIDGDSLRTEIDPGQADDCLSGGLVNEAATARADAELAIANEHRSNVEAWIGVLGQEAAAVGL